MIYLDGAATTPVLPEVIQAISQAFTDYPANPSSLHSLGAKSSHRLEQARTVVASFIGASPSEIIFTSSATEGNNTIFHSFSNAKIYISPFEHPSVSIPARHYASTLTVLSLNSSDFTNFSQLSLPPTSAPSLISIQLASSETGHIFSLPTSLPDNYFLHSDLTAIVGKLPVNVKKLHLDYATFSAHKLGGPVGIGVLYVKNLKNTTHPPLSPLILGGHQESNFRAGTTSVPLAIGLETALKYIAKNDIFSKYSSLQAKRNLLAKELQSKIPDTIINSSLKNSLPHLLNISFPGAEGESTELHLDLEEEISVGTGSACATGTPSPALLAIYPQNPELAHSSIRISLPLDFTEANISKITSTLPNIIKNLRSISTYQKGQNDK